MSVPAHPRKYKYNVSIRGSMGHHINEKGEFQSDKHPELPPDRIRINFQNPRSHRALWYLASDYQSEDSELAEDIRTRLKALDYDPLKGVK